MIRAHHYVLAVPDLDRSAAFYRDALGFTVHAMGDPGWRLFVKDECRIMAGACPDALPAGPSAITPTSAIWSSTTPTPTMPGPSRPARR